MYTAVVQQCILKLDSALDALGFKKPYEKGSITQHCIENLLWKRLWTCCKTDYKMNAKDQLNHTFFS